MMKERAQVAGGTFDLVSASGHGTAIVVRFPDQWLQANEATHAPEQAFSSDPVERSYDRGGSNSEPEPSPSLSSKATGREIPPSLA
jgi:hypothetical protein